MAWNAQLYEPIEIFVLWQRFTLSRHAVKVVHLYL